MFLHFSIFYLYLSIFSRKFCSYIRIKVFYVQRIDKII